MESKIKYYKSGNYIISSLFIVLLGMLLYCAKVVEQDKVIYYLSMLCIGAWACLFYNNLKKERKEIKNNNSEVAVVIEEKDMKKVTNSLENYAFEEDNHRINMLNNAMKSTLMVVDNDEQSIGTGVILSEDGMVMIARYYFSDKVDESYASIGNEILFKKYSSDKIIKGTVIKEVFDSEGNAFSLVEIGLDNELSNFTINDSNETVIGTKVYGLNAFRENNSINVIEGVISQIKQLNIVDINGLEVFKSSKCLLYNGVSTDESIGGPLLNSEGELIGILLGRSKQYDRLNFALPINEIKDALYEVNILSRSVDNSSNLIEVVEKCEKVNYSDDRDFEEEKEELINNFEYDKSVNSTCDIDEFRNLDLQSDAIDYNRDEEENEFINKVENIYEDYEERKDSYDAEETNLEIDNTIEENDRNFEEEKDEFINKFNEEYKAIEVNSEFDNVEEIKLKANYDSSSILEIYSYDFKDEETINKDEVYDVDAYNEDGGNIQQSYMEDSVIKSSKIEICNIEVELEKNKYEDYGLKNIIEENDRESDGVNEGSVLGLEIVNPLQDGVRDERGNM